MSDLYFCEDCRRMGPIDSFNDECEPGWTHGRLIRVPGLLREAFEAGADASRDGMASDTPTLDWEGGDGDRAWAKWVSGRLGTEWVSSVPPETPDR